MNAQRFAGKVLVVTGAAQGIGCGVALRAAAEGGKVLFVDLADFVGEVAAQAAGADTAGFVADLETYEGAAATMACATGCFVAWSSAAARRSRSPSGWCSRDAPRCGPRPTGCRA